MKDRKEGREKKFKQRRKSERNRGLEALTCNRHSGGSCNTSGPAS